MDTNGKEACVTNDSLTESISSGGDVMQAIRIASEVLTRVELAVSRSSENLVNDLKRSESSNTKLNEHLLTEANTLRANLLEAVNELVLFDSEAFTLREKVCFLEKQLKESDHQLMNARDENQDLLHKLREMSCIRNDLEEKISRAESRADSAEAKCKLLTESNMELSEELNLLKGSRDTSEMVELLKRPMRESDIALQSAVASSEASQEKQSMLSYTIKDMENVIAKLKLKVSKAENLAETAEDKCLILSECNSDLAEELCFLRDRMDCLKASLHEAEESKKATGNKLITYLVMQPAMEKEHLQKQEVKQSQQTSNSAVHKSYIVKGDEDHSTSTISMKESNSVNMKKKDEIDKGLADSTSNFARNTDANLYLEVILFGVFMAVAVWAACVPILVEFAKKIG